MVCQLFHISPPIIMHPVIKDEVIGNMELLLQTAADAGALEAERQALEADLADDVKKLQGIIEENARRAQDQEEYEDR